MWVGKMSKRYGFAKYEGEETPETDAVVQPTRQVRNSTC